MMGGLFKHSSHVSSFALLLFAFAGVLGMAGSLYIGNPIATSDTPHYLLPIHNLIAHRGYTLDDHPEIMFPPGLGMLSYLVYLSVGNVLWSAVVVTSVCYVAIILIAYYICRVLFDRNTAVLTAGLVTFHPFLVRYGLTCVTDVPFTMFLLGAFAIYLRALFSGFTWFRALVLGLSMGMLYLLRPEGFLVAMLAFSSLSVYLLLKRLIGWPARVFGNGVPAGQLPYVVLSVCIFLLASLPYLMFLHAHTGKWVLSTKMAYNIRLAEANVLGVSHKVETPQLWGSTDVSFTSYVRGQGRAMAARIVRNSVTILFYLGYTNFHAIAPFTLLWLAYPLICGRRLLSDSCLSERAIIIASAFLVFFAYAGIYLFFWVEPRFLLPVSVLVLICIGRFTVVVLENLSAYWGKPLVRTGIVMVVALSVVCPLALDLLRSVPRLPYAHYLPLSLWKALEAPSQDCSHLAAAWLRRNHPSLERLTVIGPIGTGVVCFHLGDCQRSLGRHLSISPSMGVQEIVRTAQANAPFALLLHNENNVLNNLYAAELGRIWENPELARDYGLSLVWKSENASCQLYGSVKTDHGMKK
jgi:4-amino-4-deoxy-L-arabinose transferase-like glycosyltransferase